ARVFRRRRALARMALDTQRLPARRVARAARAAEHRHHVRRASALWSEVGAGQRVRAAAGKPSQWSVGSSADDPAGWSAQRAAIRRLATAAWPAARNARRSVRGLG